MKRQILMTILRYLHPRSAVSFWHTDVGPVLYPYETFQDYYIDLRAKTSYRGPYSPEGVPMLDYFGSIGRQYNPCAVAQWGLGAWQRWRRGELWAEPLFWRAVEWLRRELDVDAHGRGYWWYRFDFDAYGLSAPWASALAQAQGMSVLLRAYHLTGEPADLQCVRQACSAMLTPVEEGGLLLEQEGNVILEEVVADRATAILDGMMFAIFGLQDYCFVNDDARAHVTLALCYNTLEALLPRYDLGYWSRADLYSLDPPMPASAFYHGLHVAQLKVLSQLSGRPLFSDYARRWEAAANSPINRMRAFLNKVHFKFRYY